MSEAVRVVHAYLQLAGGRIQCRRCGADVCAAAENYKLHASRADRPVAELGARYAGLSGTLDDSIVFRVYSCPSCGRRLDAEVCPASAEPVRDFEIPEEEVL